MPGDFPNDREVDPSPVVSRCLLKKISDVLCIFDGFFHSLVIAPLVHM